jgi:hypothetical protein
MGSELPEFDLFKNLPPSKQDTGPKEFAILTNYFGAPTPSSEGDLFANFKWVTLGVCTVILLIVLNPWVMSWVQEKGINRYIVYAGQVLVLVIVVMFLCR